MQLPDQVDQVFDASTQPVQFPNNQGVLFAQYFQDFGQPGSLRAAAADLIVEDLLAARFG